MQNRNLTHLLRPVPQYFAVIKTVFAGIGALVLVGFAIVGLVSIGAGSGWHSESHAADGDAIASILAAQNVGPVARPSAAPVTAQLHAVILTSAGRYEAGEQPVLASGSTFALSLQSNLTGRVHIYAIAPDGLVRSIWQSRLQAGQVKLTPDMRLQGMQGTETLRVVLEPMEGEAGRAGPSLVRTITLLHL